MTQTEKRLLALRTELVEEYNRRVDYYDRGKRDDRWEACNPEDRDRHGKECGTIKGLAWAIAAVEKAIDAERGQT